MQQLIVLIYRDEKPNLLFHQEVDMKRNTLKNDLYELYRIEKIQKRDSYANMSLWWINMPRKRKWAIRILSWFPY